MRLSLEWKGVLLALAGGGLSLVLALGMGAVVRGVGGPGNIRLQDAPASSAARPETVAFGRGLFLKNCAHCHSDDARGDEGPDLHGLQRSDEWITRRIRNGVKGEMTAFGEKFGQNDIDALIAYLRTLK